MSNRTWTRIVNPNEPFHFGEPKPNLNQQDFTSVNLNQTWTLKIVLKWTQTEHEPLTKVRIYFSISGCRWRWYTHNKSSGDYQQDQQFLLFFFWTKRVTTVKFYVNEPKPNLNQKYFTKVNLNQTWTSKMVLKWTRTKPEPLKYFEQELNLNQNRYLKRFDTLQ